MLTARELSIVDLFRKDPFAVRTIGEMMRLLRTNSYSWTHAAVRKLRKERILLLEKKGQCQLCTINLGEQKTIIYFALLEGLAASSRKIPNLGRILSLMPLQFHILMVTGSYADGTFTDESDLDVVVVIESKDERKWLLNELVSAGDLMIPQLHPYIFTREEFLEMLTNREANYGKEIERKHLVASGAESYFLLLREAVRDGYRREPVYGAGKT